MPLGDVYEYTMYCQHADQVSVTRRYYETTALAGTEATQAQMVAALDAIFAPLFKNAMCILATYRGSAICQIWPLPRRRQSTTIANTGLGVVAGDILPRQVRGIITLRTFFAGRRYRGRVYVPFPAEASSLSDGTPGGGYQSTLDALGAALISSTTAGSAPNTTTLTPKLARIAYTGTPPNRVLVQPTLLPYEGFATRPRWATQRKSGSYGRQNVLPF